MAAPSLLATLPAALIPLVYAHLPADFKLRTCPILSRSLWARLTPACFQSDHLHLSPGVLHAILASPHLIGLLSAVSSVSVESDGAVDKALLSLLNSAPQPAAIPHPLSPISGTSLFPSLAFYSQRVNGVGFHPNSLSAFARLQQLYVDTRRYDASIALQLSATLSALHSLKLHALLSVAHLEAIYSLPALTSLDLAGCTVLGGDIALHSMPLVSLLEPASAAASIGRLKALLCPLGEQRVADIVAMTRSQQPAAVLEYLRCDDSPLTGDCIVGLLALPSLTALEIQSHNIRWEQPPFSALASSSSPSPPSSLHALRFVADHDLRDRPQSPQAVIDSMSAFLYRFQHLHVLELTLPSALPVADMVPALLQMTALRRLSLARTKSGAGRVIAADNPFDLPSWLAAGLGKRTQQAAFPVLHTLVCRRVLDLSECVLMVLLSQMPALGVLRVLESPLVSSGGLLAAMTFCPLLRSVALIACSIGMLALDSWHIAQMLLQQVQGAMQTNRPPKFTMLIGRIPSTTMPATTLLPCLRFVSLQVVIASVDTSVLQCVVGLLAQSPLGYFGFVIRDGRALAPAAPSLQLLETVAALEPLSLSGLAAPVAPLLSPRHGGSVVEYSQQWAESTEARARRERAVMAAERLTEVAESDEQLLFEWMTRHRCGQHAHCGHAFSSQQHRAQYFNDLRDELTVQRRLKKRLEQRLSEPEDGTVRAGQRASLLRSVLCCASN